MKAGPIVAFLSLSLKLDLSCYWSISIRDPVSTRQMMHPAAEMDITLNCSQPHTSETFSLFLCTSRYLPDLLDGHQSAGSL